MGASVSHYPQTLADYPIFSLTTGHGDKIKIINGNAAVIGVVRDTLHSHYGTIQDESIAVDGGTCFKLSGSFNQGGCLSVKTKTFFTQLMIELYRNGWKLSLKSDFSRVYRFSTLFFRQCALPSTKFSICCLSLSGSDKFQLINAPDTLYQSLLECVGNLVQNQSDYANCKEVKVHGTLWTEKNSSSAQMLLLKIFNSFRQRGFTYYGTVNLKGTTDSIFFINERREVSPEDYCVISFARNDTLRLISCPQLLIDMVHEVISTKWPGGVQNVKNDGDCVDYKMKGRPWHADHQADAVNSRILVTELLKESKKCGFEVHAALYASRSIEHKSFLVMRRCSAISIPHFCITPASADKIRIIGADPATQAMLLNLIRTCWTPGIQQESDGGVDYELKLKGYPWQQNTFSGSTTLARILMTTILAALELHGWSVICSADVSSKLIVMSESAIYPCNVHSWFVAQTMPISNPAEPSTSSNGDVPPSYKEALM